MHFIFFIVSLKIFPGIIALLNTVVTPRTGLPIPVNHAPVFNNNNYFYSISDTTAVGSRVGSVFATDQDGDQLMYTIKSGNTNNAFFINAATGSILIAKHPDHHAQDRYALVVKVADPGGLSNEAFVSITVSMGTAPSSFTTITWATAAPQPYATHEVDGAVVNGKLYVFGGFDVLKRPNYTPTKRAYVYEPVTNKWTSLANLPHTPNGTGFGGISNEGLATDGTDFYFAGGYPSTANGTGQVFGTKQVWRYNVLSNTYTTLPSLPIELAAGQLKYLKGKLHYMGGANKARRDTSVHYALNLDSLSAGWKVLAPLLNATNKAGSAVFEGKIYYISGSHFQNANAIPQKTVQVYDPDTDTWSKVADLPVARDHLTSSVEIMGDRIIVTGGYISASTKTNLVSAYLPSVNLWQTLTPLPAVKAAGVSGALNGNLFYTGGAFTNINYKGIPDYKEIPVQKVDSLVLINADTDKPLQALVGGDTLNLATLPTIHLNIRAITNPFIVGSVQFNLTGAQNDIVVENKAPYALFGDNGSGDYFAWMPPLGTYTLKATPFSSSGASGKAGVLKTVTFTVINKKPTNATLSPVADAFVRNGSFADENYGGDTSLEVKSSASPGFTRYSYLKFSLADVAAADSAVLRLYGHNITNQNSIVLSAFGVNDNSWAENGIDFNNAPTALTVALSSAAVTDVAKYYEFNITDFVKARLTGSKIVCLVVKDPKNSDKNIVFNSKENLQYPPQLLIVNKAESNYLPGTIISQVPVPKKSLKIF